MPLADGLDLRTGPGARLWVRRGLEEPEGGAWEAWLAEGEARLQRSAAERVGTGRGDARRVRIGARSGVWRVNRHGGLLGGLLDQRHASPARLQQEIELSEQLRARGLPTPAVLLGLALRDGLFWRQHLVTEEIAGARTVFEARNDPGALAAAGALLQRLFDAGLWATDLHPGNLLWQPDTRSCSVIDLAGARLLGRPLRSRERAARLARFRRFFAKHAGSDVHDPSRIPQV
ncbi:MAG: hypothetical protein EYC70_06730 [Planctomycetota bacterium]|nr:MAG: hypothetical protein EYC70_06730 [Planctomycetota bacterium]